MTFKPEFLNRIDEIVFFNNLDKDAIYKILDKIILDIEKNRLSDKNIKISLIDAGGIQQDHRQTSGRPHHRGRTPASRHRQAYGPALP